MSVYLGLEIASILLVFDDLHIEHFRVSLTDDSDSNNTGVNFCPYLAGYSSATIGPLVLLKVLPKLHVEIGKVKRVGLSINGVEEWASTGY